MSLFTWSRISRMRVHLVSSASSGVPKSLKVSMKMDSEVPKACQASSAVKLKNGAIQRSMACVMRYSTVCAERLANDLGALV